MLKELIPKPIRKKLYRLLFPKSPVLWANWGPLSEFLATKTKPMKPPVVILSMPRSGSSWVGEILGLSPSSLYLREPITQTHIKTRDSGPSFFEFNMDHLPDGYESASNYVFSGLPLFDRWITIYPKQWALSNRSRKRIVIKEVNPFMLDWLITNFQPRIIYLVRHPVATASSFRRMGWSGEQFDFRLSLETLEKEIPEYNQYTHSFWAEHGALQAFILKQTLACAKEYDNLRLVKYKDICEDPLAVFKDLYDFAELEWNNSVEQKIQKRIHPDKINSDPFSIYRDTAYEAKKWKKQVSQDEIAEVKKAWMSFDLPFYTESEW